MRARLEIASIAEMESFAERVALLLKPGDIILLSGPLGAGKTLLAQALIRSLGVSERVTSPTFVMVKSYRGRLPVHHIDAYRLLDLPNPREAFDELDVEIDDALTIIEWGEMFDITGNALHVAIEIGAGHSRTLTLEGSDSRWGELKV